MADGREHFQNLLQNCSEYTPIETWQLLDTIQPIDKKHIQILHSSSGPSDGHVAITIKKIYLYMIL